MNESFCKVHKQIFTLLCNECDTFLCQFCSSHANHDLMILPKEIKTDQIEFYL